MNKDIMYEYHESPCMVLHDIAALSIDLFLLPYLLQITWNQSFATLHDSIHDIDWSTAFMMRLCVCCFGFPLCRATMIKEYEHRFNYAVNMIYSRLPEKCPWVPYEASTF